VEFVLDGNGPAEFEPPNLSDWPEIVLERTSHAAKRVNLDRLSKKEMESWHAGDIILLSGRLLTGRDAAHARISSLLARGESLPVDFNGRVIYYVGPVDAVREEIVGPAGPTTATRMDKFTEVMLSETGLIAMIGKESAASRLSKQFVSIVPST
jgi:fumarate hydratase class I